MDWTRIRNDFPITKNSIYFQSAGMSPVPTPVFKAIVDAYQALSERGDITLLKDLKKVYGLKQKIASLLNTTAGNIALVANTSTGMSLLALAFCRQLSNDMNIVSMIDEFPATTVPFEYQNVTVKYVYPTAGRYPIKSILGEVDEQTVAVVTSYVQYSTGFRQDLKQLGTVLGERGILFIVNATQALPIYPIDVNAMHIDVLIASLHKWGCAGHIGAVLYTTPEYRKRFPTPIAGWLSVVPKGDDLIHTEKNVPLVLHDSAEQYTFGTFNMHTLFGLNAAIDYLQRIGLETIRDRISTLSDYLIEKLHHLPATIISPTARKEERSSIISFTVNDKNEELVTYLTQKNIHVANRNSAIRVALNIFNNHADIDRLISEIDAFLVNNVME